jgi:simple sugar transport system permease protein
MLEGGENHEPAVAAGLRQLPPAPQPARLLITLRQTAPGWLNALVTCGAVATGLLISALILIGAGVPAGKLLDEFIVNTLFEAENLRAVLAQAAPLILVGVGASLSFRVRFWNLGLEGQMICGSIAAAAVALFDLGPSGLRLPLMALAAMVAGAVWAVGPGLLAIHLKVSEVISTLLLNYVALNFLLHLLYGSWKDPKDSFPHSPEFGAGAHLPEIGWGISAALPIAIVAMALAWWAVRGMRVGVYMRFVEANPTMAFAAGVPVRATILAGVLVSGAFAALSGFCITVGQEGRLTQAFFSGYGFSGILIAFLARNSPPTALIVAVLVAVLFVAGQSLQVFYQIPFAMVRLIQAIMIICVAASEFFVRYQVRWVR